MSPTIYVNVESSTYAALRAEILASRARTSGDAREPAPSGVSESAQRTQ